MRNTLEKVFDVLEFVASCDKPISLKEISDHTGYHPSTVSRILSDLVEIGYIRKESYRDFVLDIGLVPLGQKALTHFPLARHAGPLIAETAAKLDCEGALAGLHRERLVYLFRGTSPLEGAAPEDFQYPLHRSNCAAAILAATPEEETLRLLKSEFSNEADKLESAVEKFMGWRENVRREGYSLVVEKGHWNVAFPLRRDDRTFSTALYGWGEISDRTDKIVLECSLLARRIESRS